MAKVTAMPKTTKTLDKTRIDLASNTRAEMAAMLNTLLADSSDLAVQSKHAHWNVKGPHFIGLHELFDDLHERVEAHTDEIAERIQALGGHAHGRIQDAVKGTRLPEFPEGLTDGMAHVRALATSFGVFANSLREGIDKAEDGGDKVTSDMLNNINGVVDKDLWFLEAHLR